MTFNGLAYTVRQFAAIRKRTGVSYSEQVLVLFRKYVLHVRDTEDSARAALDTARAIRLVRLEYTTFDAGMPPEGDWLPPAL